VNLVQLIQNAGMGDGEVVELLKIANGYLPRVRLEYEAEVNNSVRTYQDFCKQNLELRKREKMSSN
jgi:hypothetical protein